MSGGDDRQAHVMLTRKSYSLLNILDRFGLQVVVGHGAGFVSTFCSNIVWKRIFTCLDSNSVVILVDISDSFALLHNKWILSTCSLALKSLWVYISTDKSYPKSSRAYVKSGSASASTRDRSEGKPNSG